MRFAPGALARFLFAKFYRGCARNWRRNVGFVIAATLLYPFPFGRTNAAPQLSRPPSDLQDRASLSQRPTIQANGNGDPWISLGVGYELVTALAGPADIKSKFESDQLRPLTLTAGDLDEDGVPDLLSGFGTSDGKGILAVYRGNADAIHPNAPAARQRKLDGTFTNSPFLSPATLFDLPSAPDFLETGNFEGDKHIDVVTAARGSNILSVMDGDGRGALGPATQIALPGPVTAMTSGEVNRVDGLKDLVVAIDSDAGPELLIFEGPDGALKSTPEAIPIPASASSLGVGHLDDDFQSDIAATAGQDLIVVHGRDRLLYMDRDAQRAVAPPRTSVVHIESILRSVTVGKFSPDGAVRMAILSEDGTLKGVAWSGIPGKKGRYKVSEIATGLAPATHLVKARVSGMASDDLIIMDRNGQTIGLWSNDQERRTRSAKLGLPALTGANGAAAFDVAGTPEAVLPMRLDSDALDDMVVLIAGQSSPSIVPTACLPGQPQCKNIVVGSAQDSGPGTLRQAILDANSSPTPVLISFAIASTGVPTINLSTPLPTITGTLTIDGTTQPPTGLVELNGQNLTPDVFVVQSPSNVIRGMVINRSGNGIQLTSTGGAGGSNIIEGNLIGTDPTSTVARRNSGRGVLVNGSPANLIGGTASASINVISGNQTGVEITGNNSSQNQLQLDVIGSDLSANLSLGNSLNGVSITNGASANTIGGNVAVPGQVANVIAHSGQDGINIASGTANVLLANRIDLNGRDGVLLGSSGNTVGGSRNITINAVWRSGSYGVQVLTAANNLVQGNYIGLNFDAGGNGVDMSNGLDGVNVGGGGAGNMIGGSRSSNLGNYIGFNHGNGVGLAANNNLVQGNFIGTVNGSNLGNLMDGVNISGGGTKNSIGGLDSALGNVIGFNHGNGVSVLSGNGNSILSDLIWNNTGHGIFLAAGANDNVAAPNVTSAFSGPPTSARALAITASSVTPASGSITMMGSLTSTPNTMMTLQFFFGSGCNGTGDEFLGSLPVLLGTTSITTDSSGNASFNVTLNLPGGTSPTGFINASATNPGESTSSFSQCTGISNTCNITCPANVTVVTSAPSVTVTFNPPVVTGCSASVSCDHVSGSVFPAGSTTVTCTATGFSGTVSCKFVVQVGTPPVLINPLVSGRKFFTTAAGSNIVTGAVLVDTVSGEAWELDDDGAGNWVVFKFTFSTPSGKKFKKFLNQNSGGNIVVEARNPSGLTSAPASVPVP